MLSKCDDGGEIDVYCEGEVTNLSEGYLSTEDENESDYEVSEEEKEEEDLINSDNDQDKRKKSVFYEYDSTCDHKVLKFRSGLCFESPNQLHSAVQQYAILNGFNIRWIRSAHDKQEAVCVKGCPWRIYGSWAKKENNFVVKSAENAHNCCRSLKNRQATTKWLANKLANGEIRSDGCTGREIQEQVMAKYSLEVPLMKCYKSKWAADKLIHGTVEDHFKGLRSYIAALNKKYPDSSFDLMLEMGGHTGLYDTFKRLYICFKALRDGFLSGCRRVVGFDGTFIKHKPYGILLTAVGRDGNEGIYPIAWAVVEGETTASWSWFFELLFRDLNIKDGAGWTFISDQQKGLLNAIHYLAPNAESRNCSRHIYQNWKVKYRGLFLKSCFYKAVKSSNETDFNTSMREMRFGRDGIPGSVDAADDFMKQGPEHFCKAFFKTSTKCGAVSNNMCETFNSYIISARKRPFIEMLELIRKLLMVRQVQKSKLFVGKSDCVCPVIRKELKLRKQSAGLYVVKPSLLDKYEVACGSSINDRFVVDLKGFSCNCRYWDLHKIPCDHAMAAIIFMKRHVEDYVDECYKRTTFEMVYAHELEPLEGKRYWPTDVGQPIKPLPYKKHPGRPKKQNRRKSKDEDAPQASFSQKGLGMKCSACGGWGHNKRTCKGLSNTLDVIAIPTSQESVATSSNRVRCKNCGGRGHNRRTCKMVTGSVMGSSNQKDM